jgi:UDP-2,3-diacylglucosamine pyrophosphatase LpxH
MASPRPEVSDRLDVTVAPGGKVIAFSDLHLPPERSAVSGRSCEIITRRLASETAPLTVVLAGDIVEMLAYPGRSAADVLDSHDDLCRALERVSERGGQVIYTVGNHDGDLAWDLKAATAVHEATGAKLCLAADLVLPGGERIRVEHGHQLDPYNCFHDPRNPLDTPLGHHIVRQVIPKVEWIGRDWLTGAHEMADPADFPSFLASRLVYRKLARHLWWLVLLPIAAFTFVLPEVGRVRSRYPGTGRWLHDLEVLGYGAIVDIAIIALILAVVSRRAWTSLSALALAGRGYSQNSAARERADELIAQGYLGYLSGHTHHPELHAHGDGFYGNTGSCTSVVEAIETVYGMPPVYLRTQQLSWLEISTEPALNAGPADGEVPGDVIASFGGAARPCHAQLKSARVELPGATRFERFLAAARNPHSAAPCAVASWPEGPDWPEDRKHLRDRKHLTKRRAPADPPCATDAGQTLDPGNL